MNFNSINKILIVRLSSLGDIILTTPLIRTLKNSYPHLEIDFLIRKEFLSTLEFNPHINKLLPLERNYQLKYIRSLLKKNKYDVIIDLQNNLRSLAFTAFQSSNIYKYKKPYLKRSLLVKFGINLFNDSIPIPVRYAESISEFELDEKGLELFLPKDSISSLSNDKQYIGLCPGSRHYTKMWPKEYFIELGSMLVNDNYSIALLGGKDDKPICKYICDRIDGAVDLSNDNDLIDLASNMKYCKVLVCNDSGLMHTAMAIDASVIAIFGSTVKELGFYPYKGNNLVLENNSLSCRPCSHIGLEKCPKQHFKCMNDIKPQTVYKQLLSFLN